MRAMILAGCGSFATYVEISTATTVRLSIVIAGDGGHHAPPRQLRLAPDAHRPQRGLCHGSRRNRGQHQPQLHGSSAGQHRSSPYTFSAMSAVGDAPHGAALMACASLDVNTAWSQSPS